MTKIPQTSWSRISADFCGPFLTGEYALIMIDDHSRYPVVEVLRSTSAKSVIPVMDKIFSVFGLPKELKTMVHHSRVMNSEISRRSLVSSTGELHHYGQDPTARQNDLCALSEKRSKQLTQKIKTGNRRCLLF